MTKQKKKDVTPVSETNVSDIAAVSPDPSSVLTISKPKIDKKSESRPVDRVLPSLPFVIETLDERIGSEGCEPCESMLRPQTVMQDKAAIGYFGEVEGVFDTERLAALIVQSIEQNTLSGLISALKSTDFGLATILGPGKRADVLVTPGQFLVTSNTLMDGVTSRLGGGSELNATIIGEIVKYALEPLNVVHPSPPKGRVTHRAELLLQDYNALVRDIRLTEVMGLLEKHRSAIPFKFGKKVSLGVLSSTLGRHLETLAIELASTPDEAVSELHTVLALINALAAGELDVPLVDRERVRPLAEDLSLLSIAISQASNPDVVSALGREYKWASAVQETTRRIKTSTRYNTVPILSLGDCYTHLALCDDLRQPKILITAPNIAPDFSVQATHFADVDNRSKLFTQFPARNVEQALEGLIKPAIGVLGHTDVMEAIATSAAGIVPFLEAPRHVRLGTTDTDLMLMGIASVMRRRKDDPTADAQIVFNRSEREMAIEFRMNVSTINHEFSSRVLTGQLITTDPVEVLLGCESHLGKSPFPHKDQGIPAPVRSAIADFAPGHVAQKINRTLTSEIKGASGKTYRSSLKLSDLVGASPSLAVHVTVPLAARIACGTAIAGQEAVLILAAEAGVSGDITRRLTERAILAVKPILDKIWGSAQGQLVERTIFGSILRDTKLNPTIEDRDRFRIVRQQHGVRADLGMKFPLDLIEFIGLLSESERKLVLQWAADCAIIESTMPINLQLL